MPSADPASHLARLIDRVPPVPPRYAARSQLWSEAARMLAERLCDVLSAPVSDESVDLTMRSPAQARTRRDVVVVPMTDAYFAVRAADAVLLAERLLRAEPGADGPAALRPLDAILMANVAAEATAAIADTFGTRIAPAGRARMGWPPAGSDAAPLLCAAFTMAVSGRPVVLTVLLEGPPSAYAAPEPQRPAPCPRFAEAAADAKAPLRAVLDSWTITGAEAASLRPGSLLPLPGASIEELDLVIGLPGGAMRLGGAELGKSRGRRAVRLTGPIDLR